jgi:hypothetical protein
MIGFDRLFYQFEVVDSCLIVFVIDRFFFIDLSC